MTVKQIAKKLTNTEGMILRYVVSTNDHPVEPSRVVNHIEWSALPKTFLEARRTFKTLLSFELVKMQGDKGYTFTDLGCKVLTYGDTNDMWVGTVGVHPGKYPDSRKNKK